MRLEEEIVQKKFRSEQQKAVINIIFTSNWLNGIHNAHMKPYGITLPQFNILRILRGQHPNPATIRLLTERMLDKMSNASRLVEKLRQKGYVERIICDHDRRQVNVTITQQGLNLLSDIDVNLQHTEQDYFNRISEEEALQLNAILDKLRG